MNFAKNISKRLNNNVKRLIYSPALNKFPELDTKYLCDDKNCEEITKNISLRKGVGNINLVHSIKSQLESMDPLDSSYRNVKEQFHQELLKIPNKTHPEVKNLTDVSVVKLINEKKSFDLEPKEFHEIAKRLNLVRTEQLGNVSGSRSYFILGQLAELEEALVNYTVDKLLKKQFQLISVPDLLHRNIIESCGMNTRGERNQVYFLDQNHFGPDISLAGTSEMSIAGFLSNKFFFDEQLPLKLAAVSRCYRAETSSIAEERGIYRVHEFTKVEMFVVSSPKSSEEQLQEILSIQEELFGDLGLHLRVLDMPPHELGAPAYRKYDIEAWLPGRKIFGEISSCSNCTDYQSRRLNIRYMSDKGYYFLHTLNGTACAIPRLLIALVETYQTGKGTIEVPKVLQEYMNGVTVIEKQKMIPDLKLFKPKREN